MTHITADQAKTLLDGATPGPWMLNPHGIILQGDDMSAPVTEAVGHMYRRDPDETANGELMAAAPDLARTVIAQAAEIERLKTALTDHLRQEADGWADQ
ncbi:hypothetical protein ACT3TD_13770 [Corynebacterium sp. AOP36-E1-14]|uniref:hypothetical protein n=1 Tax=Corynebacterium sp. AOP36-E1-14 TaxID=3457682 RepID=UPI0040347FF2